MDSKVLWIWLSLCTLPSVKDGDALFERFGGSVERIYASEDYGDTVLRKKTAEKLKDKSLSAAEDILAWCEKNGVAVLTPLDRRYPKRLFAAGTRPSVLYCLGEMPVLDDRLCVGVVGTRRMSEYGRDTAYGISYDLAKAGAVIVSGMADGIDGTAHRACLDAGGKTIAVLGCGIDRAYPAKHRSLMKEIAKNGCVITEYPPTTPPDRFNFPMRNRIISGICQATLVIEAPEKSGALNTASHCVAQHRRLYAVPGKIGELSSTGTNTLLHDFARPVNSAKELLDDFADRYPSVDPEKIPSEKVKEAVTPQYHVTAPVPHAKEKAETPEEKTETASGVPSTDGLDDTEAKVLLCFGSGKPEDADGISAQTGMSISDVLSSLTLLEMYGRITALPGGKYMIN